MNKGIKLFGHTKETKELEHNPVNLRKVRDFVARYSDPDAPPFPSPEQNKKPVGEATQIFSFATERQKEGQAKKTRNKGNTPSLNRSRASTMLTKTNRLSDSAIVDSSEEEFPLIELPAATSDDENEESSVSAPTTGQNLLATENSPATFVSSSPSPFEESEHEAELPLILQPIELDPQEKSAVSAKDNVPRESEPDDAFVATGQRATFTIIDDNVAETEKSHGARTSPLREKNLSTRGRDTELTLAQFPANGEALQVEPVAAGGGEQREKSEEPTQKKTIPFLQRTRRRRVKKTRVYIGRHKAVAAENVEKTDVLLFREEPETPASSFSESPIVALDGTDHGSLGEPDVFAEESAHPDRRATVQQEVDTHGSSAKRKGVDKSRAVRRELDSLDPCLVSFLAPDSFEAEQYRVLRHLIERLREERGRSCCIVAVSSPSAGDGKTTTALNLAGALAQAADTRVLLIDADLRRPAVLERLGGQLMANHGLVKAVLHPRLRWQNTTMQYAFLNLTILPAGHLTSSSYEILKSPRFGALLEDARREYDYIILDTPPLVPIPDCRLLEQWVDGFFVVVAAHKTPRKLVQEALSVIPDEKILGLVFNGDDPPVFGYERYYGYSPLQATDNHNAENLS
jgi:capsular exopolysaccharide synthesis family protein